jgi:hypothetical protein
MKKKELIEIIEACVINSQVLTEERVCFNELRKELNEEIPEQLTLTDVSQQRELLAFGKWLRDNWKDVWFYNDEFMISEFKKANCG